MKFKSALFKVNYHQVLGSIDAPYSGECWGSQFVS